MGHLFYNSIWLGRMSFLHETEQQDQIKQSIQHQQEKQSKILTYLLKVKRCKNYRYATLFYLLQLQNLQNSFQSTAVYHLLSTKPMTEVPSYVAPIFLTYFVILCRQRFAHLQVQKIFIYSLRRYNDIFTLTLIKLIQHTGMWDSLQFASSHQNSSGYTYCQLRNARFIY